MSMVCHHVSSGCYHSALCTALVHTNSCAHVCVCMVTSSDRAGCCGGQVDITRFVTEKVLKTAMMHLHMCLLATRDASSQRACEKTTTLQYYY